MLDYQQQFFCDYYLSNNFNSDEAARKAGYSDPVNTGRKLLRMKKIKEFIEDRLREKTENLIIKQDELLGFLSRCIRGTENEIQLMVTREGEGNKFKDNIHKMEAPIKIKDRLKAAEIMTKILKLYDNNIINFDKIVINSNVPNKNIPIDDLPKGHYD